jgi:hypothetical protein
MGYLFQVPLEYLIGKRQGSPFTVLHFLCGLGGPEHKIKSGMKMFHFLKLVSSSWAKNINFTAGKQYCFIDYIHTRARQ